jgi:hypothetical protein
VINQSNGFLQGSYKLELLNDKGKIRVCPAGQVLGGAGRIASSVGRRVQVFRNQEPQSLSISLNECHGRNTSILNHSQSVD